MKERYTLPENSTHIAMTSRELAQLTGKRHDNVKRTIDTLAARDAISLPQIEEVSNTGFGPKVVIEYRVTERDSYVIVAQLSPEFTAKLVDRWMELEEQVAQANPTKYIAELHDLIKVEKEKEAEAARFQTYAEALRQAADTVEREEAKRTATNNRSLTC
tara:strand:+ start:7822 stop:8301 length:480 start_codon:yes stop_codon:yes gene_type:complete